MAVPEFQSFMLPVLEAAAATEVGYRDIIARAKNIFGLSSTDLEELIPSGRKTRVYDRVQWASVHLERAGLLERPRRGRVIISDLGRSVLASKPTRIDMDFLMRYPSYKQFRARSGLSDNDPNSAIGAATSIAAAQASETPEARIEVAALELESILRDDLLSRLKSNESRFFERVVLDVLRALGYGAGSGGMAEVTGGSGDGGIDGIIDEDRLGLDRIYVQAKRFADASVGAPVIHGFIGALHMRGATKGVLLTTSSFTKSAIEASQKNPTMRIVLIDGDRLAGLMIRHGVGVRTDRTIEIRKLDLDYFDADDA